MNREIKFRLVVEEKHPPYWEKKITFYYFTLDELLVDEYDRKGMPTWFTQPEYYFMEGSHGGECLIGKDEYTGLKDKNGKEIYESDIVRDFYGNILQVVWADCWARYMMSYDGKTCQYYLEDYHNNKTDHSSCTMEVIGNIWESPHLLANNSKL